jgi:starvation-inducible outer membrane lipoprotein
LIAQKDRAKCETLVAAIKTLSSPSSDKGTKGAAIAAYQEYFIDFEAFPPSKYAKTPSE